MGAPSEAGLAELLTPPALSRRKEDALRARAWTLTCLVAAPLTTSFAALRWSNGTYLLAVMDLFGAAGFVGSAVYLQRTGELVRSVHFSCVVGLLLLTQSVLLGGGLTGPAVAWYGMIPMTASLGLGRTRALPWTFIVVPLPLVLLIADRLGWVGGESLADTSQMLMYTIFISGLGALAQTYERVADDVRSERDEAVSALEEERKKTADLVVSRDQFVRNVSHEFRTPLNHILGATQLLSHTELDEEQRDLVVMAETSGSDLLGIIDGAIEAQDADTELDVHSDPLDIELIVSRVARGYGPRARSKGLELIVELDPSLPARAFGDARSIERVLSALLENALAFTAKGTVRFRVHYRGRGRLRFEIEDTGAGIHPRDHERIFEPFRQVDESDTRRHGGLGAGLAVCRRLARHMGGDVTVQSLLGSGSTFTFDVRIREDRGSGTGDVGTRETPRGRTRDFRVLLGEANPRTRRAFTGTLEKMGLRSTGVGSQDELRAALERHTYDVIFVDLDLPGLRPLETDMKQALPEALVADATLVALTRSEPGRDPHLPEGFHDQLPKPLRREQVVDILRQLTEGGRGFAA